MGGREGGGTRAVVAGSFNHGGGDPYLVVELGAGVTDAVGGGEVAFEQVEEGVVVRGVDAGVPDVEAAGALEGPGGLGAFGLTARGRGGGRGGGSGGVIVNVQVDGFDDGGGGVVGWLGGEGGKWVRG